jgi:hypothetical protein
MLCSVPLFLFYKKETTGANIFFMSGLCQPEAGMGKTTEKKQLPIQIGNMERIPSYSKQ